MLSCANHEQNHGGLTCSLSNQAEEAKSGGKDIKKEERQNKSRSRALRFGRLERRGGTLEALRNQLATASSPAANSW